MENNAVVIIASLEDLNVTDTVFIQQVALQFYCTEFKTA